MQNSVLNSFYRRITCMKKIMISFGLIMLSGVSCSYAAQSSECDIVDVLREMSLPYEVYPTVECKKLDQGSKKDSIVSELYFNHLFTGYKDSIAGKPGSFYLSRLRPIKVGQGLLSDGHIVGFRVDGMTSRVFLDERLTSDCKPLLDVMIERSEALGAEARALALTNYNSFMVNDPSSLIALAEEVREKLSRRDPALTTALCAVASTGKYDSLIDMKKKRDSQKKQFFERAFGPKK